jgi:hypothetical protein
MTAGLPGTGIGGVFYLLSALVMPFSELAKTVRGRSSWSRWALVIRQFGMAVGIVTGMWLLGVLLGFLLKARPDVGLATAVDVEVAGHVKRVAGVNVLSVASVIMTMLTLTIILALTNVLRMFCRPTTADDLPPGKPVSEWPEPVVSLPPASARSRTGRPRSRSPRP